MASSGRIPVKSAPATVLLPTAVMSANIIENMDEIPIELITRDIEVPIRFVSVLVDYNFEFSYTYYALTFLKPLISITDNVASGSL